jgi:hypothetical protein
MRLCPQRLGRKRTLAFNFDRIELGTSKSADPSPATSAEPVTTPRHRHLLHKPGLLIDTRGCSPSAHTIKDLDD